MLCEFCHKSEAGLHFKQAVNGDVREIHLCASCAKKHGFDVDVPMSLTDFLFGTLPGAAAAAAGPTGRDKVCPVCQARWSDYSKTSRLGCYACYETFAEELEPVLASMQRGNRHVGKIPLKERDSEALLALKKALADAVAAQNYEEAARLRDRLKALREAPAAASAAEVPHAD